MSAGIDLRQLAVERSASPPKRRRPRHLVSRYLLPGGVIVGFLAALGWSARDALLPATPVTVVPVITTRSQAQPADTPLFQAAGWIEPRPTPAVVTALAEGIVERLVVVEGQQVKVGEPVAYLIDRDAELGVLEAEATLELQKAELDSAEATLAAAKITLAEPIQLQVELAEAEANLASVNTDLARLPFQIRAARSRQELAQRDMESKTTAKDAIAILALHRAQAELEIASASIEEQQAQLDVLQRQRAALTQRRDSLQRLLELKTEETRRFAEATALVRAAQARARQAEVALDTAKLRLERMIVRANLDGRVLALVARPGSKVMGLAPESMHDASTVVTLYDPASLQVRVDVRLEDVPQVQPGQSVRIETPAAPGTLSGRVLVATSLADIQKNTLQVKVAIDSPPPVIKPDMLVQVTFLAPPRPPTSGDSEDAKPLRLLVPRSLITDVGGSATVWIADQASGVAQLRPVTLGSPAGPDLVEVAGGLSIGDRLIASGREGLVDGRRIRIDGEAPDYETAAHH